MSDTSLSRVMSRVIGTALLAAVTSLGLAGSALAATGAGLSAAPAAAAVAGTVTALPVAMPDLRCDPGDRSCDTDGDRIPDAVEQVVCGSATCATGAEDADGDGVPD